MKRSAAITLAAAAIVARPGRVVAQSSRPIRIGFSALGESLAEGAYAVDGGFFARAGIAAELVPVTGSAVMNASILAGDIDIGPSNVASMAAAYVRGLRPNLFAPSTIISSAAPPTTIVAVAKDSPLRVARDFNGKTFACNAVRDLQQAAVMTWMDKNGGDSSTAKFVEMAPYEQPGALANGRIDAACLVEPFLSSPENDTRQVARPYDSLAPNLMTFGWIANTAWYDGNPDLVRRVVGTLRAAARWANANHAATAAINAKYSKVPVSVLLGETRQLFGEGNLEVALVQPIVDACAHYGFLPQRFAAGELFATTKAST